MQPSSKEPALKIARRVSDVASAFDWSPERCWTMANGDTSYAQSDFKSAGSVTSVSQHQVLLACALDIKERDCMGEVVTIKPL
jgi:hypothetical protein